MDRDDSSLAIPRIPDYPRCASSISKMIAITLALGLTVVGSEIAIGSDTATAATITDLLNEVSATNLIETVKALQEYGPAEGVSSRAFYLDSTTNASVYIHDRMAALGLGVSYQSLVLSGRSVRNVIGIMNGTDPTANQVLFGAHYDSENYLARNYSAATQAYGAAPGADDDASGIAAVLEIARVLHERSFRNTIKFVAFTAEEYGYDHSGGLKGSSVFVSSEKAAGVVYAGTAIMDMIAYKSGTENVLTVIKNENNNLLADSIARTIQDYGLDLSLMPVVDSMAAYSDHYPFWVSEYPSILLIEQLTDGYPANPYYHTANDTYDRLSPDLLEVTTKATIGGALNILTPEEKGGVNIILILLVVVIVAVAAIGYLMIRKKKVE